MGKSKKKPTKPSEDRVLRRSPRVTAVVKPRSSKPPAKIDLEKAPSNPDNATHSPVIEPSPKEDRTIDTTPVAPRVQADPVSNIPTNAGLEIHTDPPMAEPISTKIDSATDHTEAVIDAEPITTVMPNALIIHPSQQVTSLNPKKATKPKKKIFEPQETYWFFSADGIVQRNQREPVFEEILMENPPEPNGAASSTSNVIKKIFGENSVDVDVETTLDADHRTDENVWGGSAKENKTAIDEMISEANLVNDHLQDRVISDDYTHSFSTDQPKTTESEVKEIGKKEAEITSSWTDDEQPLVSRVTRKRKYLGKGPAKKPAAKVSKKKPKKVTFEGETSGTKNADEDAAASLLQQTSVGKKRKRGKEEDSEGVFVNKPDRPWHGLSCKAAEKVWLRFENKIGLPDKGFDTASIHEFHFIKQVVEAQQLHKVCTVYRSYNLPLVKEFYCELAVNASSKLTVRGVPFHLTPKKINKYLELSPPKRTEYCRMLKNTTMDNLNEAAELLGKPNTKWEYHGNIMLRTFKSSNLNPDANVWMNLLRHSIQPTTHDTHISVERMLLLYCLVTGKTINLGRIIMKSIRDCITRTRGKFYFPGMLTTMMIEKGVPQYKEDLIVTQQREPWEIDLKAVSRMRDRREQRIGAPELMVLLTDLLNQNSTLIDTVLKQRNEFMGKLDSLHEEMRGIAEKAKKKELEAENAVKHREENEELRTELSKLKKMVVRQQVEIDNLISKQPEEENAELMREAEEIVKRGAEEIFKKNEEEHDRLRAKITNLRETVLFQKVEIQQLKEKIPAGDSAAGPSKTVVGIHAPTLSE